MSPQDMPDGVEPAPPSSLPPDVATPEVAAGSAAHLSDEESDRGLSPVGLPSAAPHPDLALPAGASTRRQVFGLLAAPIAWAAQQQAGYSLATMLCTDQHRLTLHLVTIVALLIALAGAWVGWTAWRAVGQLPVDEGGPPGRTRFVGLVGAVSSVSFATVIFAQGLPSFFFPICR